MTRVSAILFAAFVAAAPLEAAAQSWPPRVGPEIGHVEMTAAGLFQSGGPRSDRGRPERQERRISEAQAQMIAQSRAGGARYVGSRGLRGNVYVFLFERDGRVIEITVSASGGF